MCVSGQAKESHGCPSGGILAVEGGCKTALQQRLECTWKQKELEWGQTTFISLADEPSPEVALPSFGFSRGA